MNKQNKLKNLAGQTLVYGLGTIVPRVLNYLLLTPFYTRIFLQEEYGVVIELYAYIAFLLVILTYGMETGFFRFYNKNENPDNVYKTSLLSLLTTSSIFIVIVILFKSDIANLLKYPDKEYYIILFSSIVAIDAFTSIPFAKLRSENKAIRFSVIKIINVTLNIFFNILFFVILPENENSFVAQLIYNKEIGVGYAFIANLIASIVTVILLLPDILSLKGKFDFKLIKRILSYTYPLIIVGIAGMINEVADKIFLKFLIKDKEFAMKQVGIYGASYKLAILMTIFTQMFKYAAEPFFFANKNEKDSKAINADILKYFTIFGLFIFVSVMLYIDIVKYFIGSDFHEGLRIVPLILLANLFLGIYYNLSVWYKLTDNTLYGAGIAIIGAIITIALNFILIPVIGYYGSAIATIACYFTMMVLSFFIGKKFYEIKYEVKRIVFYILFSICIVFIYSIIDIEIQVLKYLFSTGLLIVFLSVIVVNEKLYKRIVWK